MDVREDRYAVKTYECGPAGVLRLDALMRHMQESAALHAEDLDFGRGRLEALESYWVLSNMIIRLARLPQWNEEYVIRTWPSGHSRIVATREFEGCAADGERLFQASSDWMVLDKTRNRPRNLDKLEIGNLRTGSRPMGEKLPRLETCSGLQPVEEIRVPFSAIDLNGHVNNTEYVRWGMDALRLAQADCRLPAGVHMTFLAEVFESDRLGFEAARDSAAGFLQAVRPDGAPVFLMRVEYGHSHTA